MGGHGERREDISVLFCCTYRLKPTHIDKSWDGTYFLFATNAALYSPKVTCLGNDEDAPQAHSCRQTLLQQLLIHTTRTDSIDLIQT